MKKTPRPDQPIRVMIVEDDPLIAIDLEQTILALGWDVAQVCLTLATAMEAVDTLAPDVVLTDLVLADQTAKPLIESLERRSVPMVLCTGVSHRELAALYPTLLVVTKPFAEDDLRAAILTALGSDCATKSTHAVNATYRAFAD